MNTPRLALLLVLSSACASSIDGPCASDADCGDALACIDSSCQDAALRRGFALGVTPETASRNVAAGVKPQDGWFTVYNRTWSSKAFAISCNQGAAPAPATGSVGAFGTQKINVGLQPPPQGTSRVTCQVTSGSGGTVYDSFRLTLHASGGGGSGDFAVSVSPASVTLNPGENGTSAVTVSPSGGFASDVSLSVSGVPQGATASFDNATVTGGSGSAALAIDSGTAASGAYSLTVSASGGGLSHSASIALTIAQPAPSPDFSVSASPASLSLAAGGSGHSAIGVAPSGGFNSDVALGVAGLPKGASASFDNATVGGGSGSATLTVDAGTAAAGDSTLTITATGGGLTHAVTLSLAIAAAAPPPDFSVAASPGTISIAAGGAAGASAISVTPSNGFAADVSLTLSGLPASAKGSFDSGTIAGGNGSAHLDVAATSTAATGTTPVTVTASGGGVTHSITVELVITPAAPPPDFSVAVNPGTIAITAGGAAGSSTVTVSPVNGWNSSVSLSASGAPSGSTLSFSSATLGSGSGSSTLSMAAPSTGAGSYTLTVTASGGGLTRSATIALSVAQPAPPPDFSLSASPSSLALTAGQSGASTITVTPANGFSGAVTLTASGVPSGATASFSGSTLTVATGSSTATGSYAITVTGSGGGKTHTVTVGLAVSAPQCTPDTWSNWAHSFFTSSCTACHSQFGTYSGVSSDKSNIQSKISDGSMPLGSTLSASDKSRILTWLSCGLPQ